MSSNTAAAMAASSTSSVVLDEQPSATVGIQVRLHPLPIINMSEHIMRTAIQDGSTEDVRVFGALLGTQSGRTIEIQTTFELTMTADEGGLSVDHTYLRARQAQFKQVFPTFDFLGWYANGTLPTTQDMRVHRQLLEYNESPLFLQLSPTQRQMDKARSAGELPIGIYETFLDLAQQHSSATASEDRSSQVVEGGPKMLFRPAHYQIETGEAERIAVDHASKPPVADDEMGQSSLIATLTTQRNAVQMLLDRIQFLCAYVADVQANKVPRDHEALRQISSLLAGLPASGELQEFKDEFLTEYDDLLLTTFLADVTNGLSVLNELVDKFDASQTSGEEGLGGGIAGGIGGPTAGGTGGWRVGRGGRAAGKAAIRSYQT